MIGVEAGGSGALLIAAQGSPQAEQMCSSLSRLMAWDSAFEPKSQFICSFPSGHGSLFPFTEESRGSVQTWRPRISSEIRTAWQVPTKVAWEYIATIGRIKEYYSIFFKYPGIWHSWGIGPLGSTWCHSKSCCLSSSLCWKSEDGRE